MRQYSWHQAKQLPCQDCQKKGHGKIGKIETEIAQHLERESRHCCSAISSIYLFRYNRTGDLGAFKLKLHCHGNCTNGAAAAKQEIYFFHRLPESYNWPKKGGTSPPPLEGRKSFLLFLAGPTLTNLGRVRFFVRPQCSFPAFLIGLTWPHGLLSALTALRCLLRCSQWRIYLHLPHPSSRWLTAPHIAYRSISFETHTKSLANSHCIVDLCRFNVCVHFHWQIFHQTVNRRSHKKPKVQFSPVQ